MGVFKLGKMTFGSMFKKPETVLYPIEQKPQPAGLKGHIAIDADACILCGMCERSCSTDCITVNKKDQYWEIDRLQCVQCGYCITVCPKKCLSMDPNYAPATTERHADRVEVLGIPQPAKKKEAAVAKPESKDTAPEPVQEAKAQPKTAPEGAPKAKASAIDRDVEAKLAIMDEEKAQKVREALAARS